MEPSDSIIAVTGAGGFIGHSLCKRLIAEKTPVRALVRYRSDLPGEFQFDMANNIMDPAALAGPVRAVVHCAWETKARSRKELKRVNVEGTRWLIDRCRAAGIGQFVFVSALGAKAFSTSLYLRTKKQVEEMLLGMPEAGTFSTVIAPGVVIGDGGVFARARAAVKHRGIIPVSVGLGRRLPTVFIDDLCSAIIASISNRVTGRTAVANPSAVSLRNFYRGLAILERRRPMLLAVPGLGLLPARVRTGIGLNSPVSADHLVGGENLKQIEMEAANGPPGLDCWQAIEKLAMLQGAEDVAAKIREHSVKGP